MSAKTTCPGCGRSHTRVRALGVFYGYDGNVVPYAVCGKCTKKMRRGSDQTRGRIIANVEFNLGVGRGSPEQAPTA